MKFLARVASHIPDKGQVLQRYNGGTPPGRVAATSVRSGSVGLFTMR